MTINIILHHKTFSDLIRNENITENGIYTYLCLKAFVNKNCTYLPINIVKLNSILSDDDISHNTKQKNCIRTGLKELEQAGFIKIISNKKNDYELDLKKNDYELDLDGMVEPYDKDNPYTVFPVDAFRQTLKDCGNKKTIFKFLSGFFYELTHNEITANTDGSELWFFNATREELAESCGINIRSLDTYLDILQKNKIIYTFRYNYKYSDSHKQLTNAYGLYKNKDEIDKRCNKYIDDNKDIIYPSYIPRGKGSKKLMEEAKEAQYAPVEEATDEELREHDKRHKELFAKRMAKKMEKEKPVVTESVPMEEVEEVVQADSKDFDTIIAERKAETNAILSDSNKEETIQTDNNGFKTIVVERKSENKATLSDNDSNDDSLDTKETTVDKQYCLTIPSRSEAIRVYSVQLAHADPFDNDFIQPKLIGEFANEWDNQHKEEVEEEEDNPFA